jgi:hypothetical protein
MAKYMEVEMNFPGVDQDGRTPSDIKRNFHYSSRPGKGEYLIAYATIKKVGKDSILTEEWPHEQAKGDFFPGARKGQKWTITYNGNSPWTLIRSAERTP